MKKKILATMLFVLVLMLAGCTSSSSVTYQFSDMVILGNANEAYTMEATTIEWGKENKGPYVEIGWNYDNDGADAYSVDISHVTLDGEDVTADATFEKGLRVGAGEQKGWTIRVKNEAVETAKELVFDTEFHTDSSRLFHIQVDLTDRKNYTIRYQEEVSEEPAAEAESETSSSEEEEDAADAGITDEERTAWGSDAYGYITLDDTWHPFRTIDVSDEQNDSMLQWQSEDNKLIVTMTAGANPVEEIMDNMAASEEDGTYEITYAGEGDADYLVGIFTKHYEDDTNLCTYVFTTDYVDRSYYVAVEDTVAETMEEFLPQANAVILTHSELQKTNFIRDILVYLSEQAEAEAEAESSSSSESASTSTSSSSEEASSEAAASYDGGTTYPLHDWMTDEKLLDVTIPEGFEVNMKDSDRDLLVLDKKGGYEFIWIDAYPESIVNDFRENGKLSDEYFDETDENISVEMVEESTLANGMNVYVLEVKYTSTKYDYDADYYYVSIQKDEDTGVSVSLPAYELAELGFETIQDLIRTLFG